MDCETRLKAAAPVAAQRADTPAALHREASKNPLQANLLDAVRTLRAKMPRSAAKVRT